MLQNIKSMYGEKNYSLWQENGQKSVSSFHGFFVRLQQRHCKLLEHTTINVSTLDMTKIIKYCSFVLKILFLLLLLHDLYGANFEDRVGTQKYKVYLLQSVWSYTVLQKIIYSLWSNANENGFRLLEVFDTLDKSKTLQFAHIDWVLQTIQDH